MKAPWVEIRSEKAPDFELHCTACGQKQIVRAGRAHEVLRGMRRFRDRHHRCGVREGDLA